MDPRRPHGSGGLLYVLVRSILISDEIERHAICHMTPMTLTDDFVSGRID